MTQDQRALIQDYIAKGKGGTAVSALVEDLQSMLDANEGGVNEQAED